MKIKLKINGVLDEYYVDKSISLYDFLRSIGLMSVKKGCDSSNCGLCSVLCDGKAILSCSALAIRFDGCSITTLEGLQDTIADFITYLANEGVDQCGFCSPGLIINIVAMCNERNDFSDQEIKEYLANNLCRCSGYAGQARAIKKFIANRGRLNYDTCK